MNDRALNVFQNDLQKDHFRSKWWETNRDPAPFKRMRPCNKHFPSFAIEKGCLCHWMSRCSDELCVCAFTCMMVCVRVFAHAYSPSGVCSHLLMCWTTEITPFLCRGTTSSHLSFLASVLLVCVCEMTCLLCWKQRVCAHARRTQWVSTLYDSESCLKYSLQKTILCMDLLWFSSFYFIHYTWMYRIMYEDAHIKHGGGGWISYFCVGFIHFLYFRVCRMFQHYCVCIRN